MASVGGVSSGMNGSCCSLVAPGSTAWLSVVQVSGNVSSHLHTACHYLLVLTSTWIHLRIGGALRSLVGSNLLSAWGIPTP